MVAISTPSPSVRHSILLDFCNKAVDIDDLWFQRMIAPELEKLACEFRPSCNTCQGIGDASGRRFITGYVLGKKLQVRCHDLQQVVEVMGDAAGKSAGRLHLLSLS